MRAIDADASLPSGMTDSERIDAAAELAAGTTKGTLAANTVAVGSSKVPTLVQAVRHKARLAAPWARMNCEESIGAGSL